MAYGVVEKGGTQWLKLSVKRGPEGLKFRIKVDARLEKFFESQSGGKTDPLETYGKAWKGNEILVYRVPESMYSGGYGYRLGTPATAISPNMDGGINLSFLQFKGTSVGDGVEFEIPGPIKKEDARTLCGQIIEGARQLIKDYIVPVHITLTIVSTEGNYEGY